MIILNLKYLVLSNNVDVSQYKSFILTISKTINSILTLYVINFPYLINSNDQIIANVIDKMILIEKFGKYWINLFGVSSSNVTLLFVKELYINSRIYGNILFPVPLNDLPTNQSQAYRGNENNDIFTLLSENFYLINTSNKNNCTLYCTLTRFRNINELNQVNLIKPYLYNIIGNNTVLYNRYSVMLTKKVNATNNNHNKFNNYNTFQILLDSYDNNFIMNPCFSYLSVFVESNIDSSAKSYLSQLDFFDINNAIINNFAFINKIENKYGNDIYVPYVGKLVNMTITTNCLFIQCSTSYFISNKNKERSFRELTFGHRENHVVYSDMRYAVQNLTPLEFYLIIVSYDSNSINVYNYENWLNKGQKICSIGGKGIVISIFNKEIRFLRDIAYYLSKNIDCLIKNNDIIGEIL